MGGALEISNLAWKFQSRRAILIFFNLWALRVNYFSKNFWKASRSAPKDQRAILRALDTQTPERASKKPVRFSEGSQEACSGVSVYRVHRHALLVKPMRAPWRHKPLSGLLKPCPVPRRFSGGPFSGEWPSINFLGSGKMVLSRAFSGRVSGPNVYVVLILRCFRTPGTPIRKILVYTGVLPCLVP